MRPQRADLTGFRAKSRKHEFVTGYPELNTVGATVSTEKLTSYGLNPGDTVRMDIEVDILGMSGMRLMRDRFVAGFAEAAARPGWALTYTSNEIARFVRAGGAGAEHWLTLDVSVRAYGLRLNPVLSVRHVEVAELAGRMLGRGGDAAQAGKALADLVRADGRPPDAE